MQNNLQELMKYRIAQAHETIKEVEFLLEKGLLVLAINRIYYGMFYMLLALALENGFKTSKHNQLIGWFNKEFVKTGTINRNIGKIVHNAFEDRTDGDYGLFVHFEKDEVKTKLENMKIFIDKIENLLSQ